MPIRRNYILLFCAGICCLFFLSCGVMKQEGSVSVESGYRETEEFGPGAPAGTEEHTEAPLLITEGTVPEGVSVLRVSLSGRTEEEAIRIIDVQFDKLLQRNYCVISEGQRLYLGADELHIGAARERAYNEMRETLLTGSEQERTEKALFYREQPKEIAPILLYDESLISDAFRKTIRENWAQETRNASVSFEEHGKLLVTEEEQEGISYDFSAGIPTFIAEIADIYNYKKELSLPAVKSVREPVLTRETAESLTVIGSFSTVYTELSDEDVSARTGNLISGCRHMNGQVFAPGETISALAMYGEMTEENGYYKAGTFQGGDHVEEIGGGLCQTATTLYNAALLAELEIVYRTNHSMYVNYVLPSMDAMVYPQNSSDFIMKNSTSAPLVIEAYVTTEDRTIHVNLWGKEERPAGHSVRYEPEILELTLPEISFRESMEAGIGWVNVSKKIRQVGSHGPVAGVRSRLWKITVDDGEETRELVNGNDIYQPDNGAVYAVSPDAYAEIYIREDSPSSCFIGLRQLFADRKTPLNADPARMSAQQREAFNREMQDILSEKGYSWPYSGSEYRNP